MHRSKRKRNMIIFSLVGVLLCMVVGYAAFNTKLEIKGTSKVTSNWDIRITNVTDGTPIGGAENTVAPKWTNLTASMEANLYDKGDAMEYDVTIENKGTLDAKLNDILTNLENENNEAVLITFSGYTKGEVLKAGGSELVHVKIEYNPDYDGGETSSEVEINFDYGQNNSEESPPDNMYLVIYDCTTNGGKDCTNHNEYFVSGSAVDLNKVGEKEGYSFVGWNIDSTANEGLMDLVMGDSDITLYAIFKDVTPPVCTLKVIGATIDTVTIEATCEDVSGISKYEYAMNNSDYVDNETKKTYTFDSFDLSTIKLRATDGANNQAEFALDTSALEEGYDIIYDVLEKKYQDLSEKENNFKNNFLNKTYPVGSIYISTNSTNPSSLFGGTWESYGAGRTIVGVGSNGETNYASAGLIGGNEKISLAVANLPAHTHSFTPSGTVSSTFKGNSGTLSSTGAHTHSMPYTSTRDSDENDQGGAGAVLPGIGFADRLFVTGYTINTTSAGAHTHTFTAKGSITNSFTGTKVNTTAFGSSSSIDIRNPYITTYMWKRTA